MKLKKIFIVLISFLTIVVLSGCKTNNNDSNSIRNYIIKPSDIPLRLQYAEEAPILETENYPIGKHLVMLEARLMIVGKNGLCQ